MRHRLVLCFAAALLAGLAISPAPAAAQQSCESLASLKITNLTITSAKAYNPPDNLVVSIPPSPVAPRGPLKVPVAVCRVVAFSTPTSDSHITFELWLPPASSWNGKFEAVGNGGFIGQIGYTAMLGGLQRGYAVSGTDTGHTGADETWALNHPEKLIDWSYRAVHEMTVDSKQILQSFYGSAAKLAYWNGCSTGGKQGLTEAQRYPTDFDGIVAGAPANYITHLQAGSVYMSWVSLKNGTDAPNYIPPAKYPALHKAALAACDAKDGVTDGVIEDPTRCNFSPKAVECSGADGADCLTAPQVKTAEEIYEGSKWANGKQIYPGMEPGSELAWGMMAGGPAPVGIGVGFFTDMVFSNPNWDFRTFDLQRDTKIADSKLGSTVNAIDPNLKPFKEHGGKIVMYHGWADQLIAPLNSVNYYTSVTKFMGGANNTDDFYRLFMVPGMTHCQGGAGPSTFDMLGALEQWREHDTAPAQITASRVVKGVVQETRPLCPYPQAAIYKGSGDTNDAANFVCGNPNW